MPNMSYCRFHNTNIDLGDCLNALYEYVEGPTSKRSHGVPSLKAFIDTLGYRDEKRGFEDMIEKMRDFLDLIDNMDP